MKKSFCHLVKTFGQTKTIAPFARGETCGPHKNEAFSHSLPAKFVESLTVRIAENRFRDCMWTLHERINECVHIVMWRSCGLSKDPSATVEEAEHAKNMDPRQSMTPTNGIHGMPKDIRNLSMPCLLSLLIASQGVCRVWRIESLGDSCCIHQSTRGGDRSALLELLASSSSTRRL